MNRQRNASRQPHGYHATRIDAVVERAGYTRGAFYAHFEDKADLFHASRFRRHCCGAACSSSPNRTVRWPGEAQRSRRSEAQRESSWREESCSLRSTLDMWVSTVFTEMNSSLATSL